MNFVTRIAAAAGKFPDRVAIEGVGNAGSQTMTYAGLIGEAERWAVKLSELDVQRGDRVAIIADNDAAWVASYLGILHVGAIAVPLDTAYRPEQVAAVLENSDAAMVIVSARYSGTAQAAATARDSRRTTIIPLSDPAPGPASTACPPIAGMTSSDAAVILYTSGTTADPKGVVLTHGNLDAECVAVLAVIDCSAADVVLGVLPLFHSLAQVTNVLVPLSVGARVVFLEAVSSSTLVSALQECGITIFPCVPQFFYLIHQRVMSEIARSGLARRAMFRVLLGFNGWLRERGGWNPGRRWFGKVHRTLGSRMRLLITGGSRFDPAIGRDLYAMGFTILNGYGLTETTGAAAVQRPTDRFTASVGQPLPGVEIRIDDHRIPDTDAPQTSGEILIRGPIIMREYFNRTEATTEVLRDGWLHTGDLGRLDADGRLFITGRSKEVIVLSSGKNLYPEEIEAHYRQSPFIKELCVLGFVRAGQPSGERLHAVVVPDEHALEERGVVNVRELIRYELEGLSVQLPPHKRILSYDISLDPLPRTTTGKLRRHEIERRLKDALSPDVAPPERMLSDDDRAWSLEPRHAAALQAVATKLGRATVLPNENLELDLGLDSLERVELLTELEQRNGTKVGADVRARIFTVRQLVDAVNAGQVLNRTDARQAPSPASDATSAPLPWTTILADPPDPGIAAVLQTETFVRPFLSFCLLRTFMSAIGLLIGFRVARRPQLPSDRPFILAPNHQSFLDGFFLASSLPFRVYRRLFFVGAAELFVSPFMRWLARQVNIVPVDPDANLVAAMQAGAAGLRANRVLMLFPEGERTIDGAIRKFRRGAAILASEVEVPIVPIALDGFYSLWPRSRPFNWSGLLPWRASRASLIFGAPISIARGNYTEGTAVLQSAVEDLFVRLRREGESDGAPGADRSATSQ